MNKQQQVAQVHSDALPALIDRASAALMNARSSAEVLEARDMARVAYDATKSVGRMTRAKAAHDEVIGAVFRAQADAALIEARAKMRLADEYDAAQDRGEVSTRQNNPGSMGHVAGNNMPPATASDLGLRRDEIHEARKLRDAEAADPGKAERVMTEILDRGEEPTKAKLRRAMVPEPEAVDQPDDDKITKKLRRHFRSLTSQAQEDEWLGVRLALHEERQASRKLRLNVKALKEQLSDLTMDDQQKTIRRLSAEIAHIKSERFRAEEKFGAERKVTFALKKRVAELEKMGIAL